MKDISWHQNNFNNASKSIEKDTQKLIEQLKSEYRHYINYQFLKYQIDCANREMKDSFDQEKYKKRERENFIQQRLTGSGFTAFTKIDKVNFG